MQAYSLSYCHAKTGRRQLESAASSICFQHACPQIDGPFDKRRPTHAAKWESDYYHEANLGNQMVTRACAAKHTAVTQQTWVNPT